MPTKEQIMNKLNVLPADYVVRLYRHEEDNYNKKVNWLMKHSTKVEQNKECGFCIVAVDEATYIKYQSKFSIRE